MARRPRSEEPLRSRAFVGGALELRESSLGESVARRIQSRTKSGMNVADAFLGVQNHVLAMARATMERLVFDAFAAGVSAAEDKQVQAALDQALDLFGLWRIEADVGWFLENDIFESVQAGRARERGRARVGRGCSNARGVCEALGIRAALLGGPRALLERGESLK